MKRSAADVVFPQYKSHSLVSCRKFVLSINKLDFNWKLLIFVLLDKKWSKRFFASSISQNSMNEKVSFPIYADSMSAIKVLISSYSTFLQQRKLFKIQFAFDWKLSLSISITLKLQWKEIKMQKDGCREVNAYYLLKTKKKLSFHPTRSWRRWIMDGNS